MADLPEENTILNFSDRFNGDSVKVRDRPSWARSGQRLTVPIDKTESWDDDDE